jgi:1-acyl-sn-glycerol-3-phosphate acyltransferase
MRTEPEESTVAREVERLARDVMPGVPIAPETVLAAAGFDSLACADLALAVEDRFGVRLADADVSGLASIRDVVAAVEQRPHDRIGLPAGFGRSFRLVRALVSPFVRRWLSLRIVGSEHVPATGPVIVAANHRSMWDIPVLVEACPRNLMFMAKTELYRNWLLRRLWFELGGFPVRREIADLRAIDTSLEVLRQGLALGIYPEGTRSFTGEMLPFLKGPAWLALLTGTPIVPCGITGTLRRTRGDQPRARVRRPVTVAFGPPIGVEARSDPLTRRAEAEALTDRLLRDISALLV